MRYYGLRAVHSNLRGDWARSAWRDIPLATSRVGAVMPYGHKARQVRAYEFGCAAPIAGEASAIAQMRGRVRLWNQLVELDREYGPKRETVISPHVNAPDDEDHRKERAAERKAAFKRQDVRDALRALDEQEYEDARALWLAAAGEGLYWVNHEDVKTAWQQARRKPGDLRFHAFARESGKVSVRWQTGLPVGAALACTDTQLQLWHIPNPPPRGPILPKHPRQDYYELRIRVGSENRKPIWLVLPCYLHRPLPDGGILRSAAVLRERIGTKWRWKVAIVVETPEVHPVSQSSGRIAIDIGWRKTPDGLRVAVWCDDRGDRGEVRLEPEWLAGMAKCEDIRSIRDQHFNAAKTVLSDWLQKHSVAAWLTEATKTLGQWRACARLAALVLRWRVERFDGDGEAFEACEAWRRRDKHLLEYSANLRDRLLRARRYQYRQFAANVARQYDTCLIEDFDLRQVATKRKHGGTADDIAPGARHQRVLAATSTLRSALANACGRDGVTISVVEAAYTSLVCPVCGSLEQFDKAAAIRHTCSICGCGWDQDYAAAVHLLHGGVSQNEAVIARKEDLRVQRLGAGATSG